MVGCIAHLSYSKLMAPTIINVSFIKGPHVIVFIFWLALSKLNISISLEINIRQGALLSSYQNIMMIMIIRSSLVGKI